MTLPPAWLRWSVYALAAGVVWIVLGFFIGEAWARSMSERAAFHRHNPCPSTGLRRGTCAGFEIDHRVALCAGGPDTEANMQWLSVEEHRYKTRTDVRVCRQLKRTRT